MAVPLQDLRRGRSRLEPERLAREAFDVGGRRRVRADRPGDLPDAKAVERRLDAHAVAVELEGPAEELQTERGRLGVNAVRAADRERVTVLFGACDDGVGRTRDPVPDERARALDRQGERGVENIGRREPVVEPATLGAEVRHDRVDEGRNVVIRRALELRHARRRRRLRALADALRGARRDRPDSCPRVDDGKLDGEPVARASSRPTRPAPCQVWRSGRSPRRL